MANNNVLAPTIRKPHIKPFEDVFRDRMAVLPIEKVLIYVIDTVDAVALPYLAEQFNVLGNRGWRFANSEQRQRDLLKRAIYLHKIEGTEAAILEALKIIGIENAYILHPIPGNTYNGQHSHNGSITYGGAYHWACFKVVVDYQDLLGLPGDILTTAVDLINEWKNVRSLLIGIDVGVNISDEVKVADSVATDMDYGFNEQLGPITYDGEHNYDGSATHGGSYDNFVAVAGVTFPRSFTAYLNDVPGTPFTLQVGVSAVTVYRLEFPDGVYLAYSADPDFGVTGYPMPAHDVSDTATFGVDEPNNVESIFIDCNEVAGVEFNDVLPNLTSIQAPGCKIELVSSISNAPALVNVDLSGNRLSSEVVSDILQVILGNGLSGGTLNLSGQTPPAPPTAQGLSDKADLVAAGWTVLTD